MTDAPSDAILAKVRKLLALGESPSEAEAASALAKAQALLARYGLSLSDVEPETSEVTEATLLEKRRLRAWESHLVAVVTEATFTRALHLTMAGSSRVIIIGRAVNAEAAAELFKYLHLVVLKLGRAHGDRVAHLESFKLGVVHRLGDRLARITNGAVWSGDGESDEGDPREDSSGGPDPGDRALALAMAGTASKENDAYIADRYGKTKTKRTGRRVEADSYRKGIAAGDGVSLARQLAEGSAPKRR